MSNVTRNDLSKKYCLGVGVELGPGRTPTKVSKATKVFYVDKRSEDELKTYFGREDIVAGGSLADFDKGSFDFLMAHHVLEHCSNTIETLVEWISYLNDGGKLFLTVPNARATPDASRLIAPPTHYLQDYILKVNDSSFESREHISSFLWGWCEDGGLAGREKAESRALVSQAMHAPENDLHWHVFSLSTFSFVVDVAAALSNKEVVKHYSWEGGDSGIEHVLVVELTDLGSKQPAVDVSYLEILRSDLRCKLVNTTLQFLDGSKIHDLSNSDSGKLFVVEESKLHWIIDGKALEELGLEDQISTYLDFESVASEVCGDSLASTEYLVTYDRARAIKCRLPLASGKGLELSPGARPLISKDVANVKYADKADYEQFKEVYQEDIDIKLDKVLGESLIDDVFPAGEFDYLVSSHVIEHIPDFIQFFISAKNILKDGGAIVKLVPDRRFTFDALRKDSTIDQIETAYANACRVPSRDMVYNFYANVDTNVVAVYIWDGSYQPKRMYTEAEAAGFCDKSETNIGVHCWTFTPASIRTLLEHVKEKYIPSLRIVEISETPEGCNEFLMHVEV